MLVWTSNNIIYHPSFMVVKHIHLQLKQSTYFSSYLPNMTPCFTCLSVKKYDKPKTQIKWLMHKKTIMVQKTRGKLQENYRKRQSIARKQKIWKQSWTRNFTKTAIYSSRISKSSSLPSIHVNSKKSNKKIHKNQKNIHNNFSVETINRKEWSYQGKKIPKTK